MDRKTTGLYLEHTLLTAEILIAAERACRERGDRIRFLSEEEISQPSSASSRPESSGNTFLNRWQTVLDGRPQNLVPDAVFALEYTDEPDGRNRRLCLVEADRGTMPLRRSAGSPASSIERKLRLYTELFKSGRFARDSGLNRLQVWMVTGSARRAESMKKAFPEQFTGRGLFLLTDIDSLRPQGAPLFLR